MTDLTEAKRLVEAAKGEAMTLPPNGGLPNLICWYLKNGSTLIAEHEAALARVKALEGGITAYLTAYDDATGTVYVEPKLRALLEGR